ECRVFILTMHQRSGLLIQAREAGCQGYFLKEGDGSAIIAALKSDDKAFCVSPQMKDHLNAVEEHNGIVPMYALLTRREKEVFKLYAEGLGYKEVAWNLGISPRTASVHRYNIFGKLNISSDVELVQAAREVGLLT
ncbi:MAG: response regulator transcription factor, partial [Spirochaetaceae bacterium]|nr:response regulator transcription factor [Spirochaetaceae bacterium]